jgi:hypothetical protein
MPSALSIATTRLGKCKIFVFENAYVLGYE